MVACREESVGKLLEAPGAEGSLWFIPYDHRGKACYKVFWGDYASIAEAQAARNALPPAVVGVLPGVSVVSQENALR